MADTTPVVAGYVAAVCDPMAMRQESASRLRYELNMVSLPLKRLVEQAIENGWSCEHGGLERLRSQASILGWEVVSSRTAEPLTEVLKPANPSDAQKNSLSAKYGRGDQPLHTDGAHHGRQPDVILLSASEASEVPTLLWRFGVDRVPLEMLHDLRNGLFTVRNGKDAFLAPALDGTRLRVDPACMDPSDLRARRVLAFFESVREDAERYDWKEPGKVLAIDNRRVLHARASAEGEPERTMHRVTLKLRKGPK